MENEIKKSSEPNKITNVEKNEKKEKNNQRAKIKKSDESREKFIFLYKKIKECSNIPLSASYFIENAKVFSIPILYRFLLIFTLIKLTLAFIYFIFWEKKFINFPLIVHINMLICSTILLFLERLKKFKVFFFLNILSHYYTERVFQVIYIISFIFIDDYSCYYYDKFTFSVNPGIPVFIFLSIIFFESQHFNDGLLYIYILNFLCFLYFFSLHTCFSVYVPVNIDIGIFILITVIAHNIGRKLFISETFFKFYEKVLEILYNELGITLICENGVIFPKKQKEEEGKENNEIKRNRKNSIGSNKRLHNSLRVIDDLIMGDETSNEGDFLSSISIPEKNNERIEVPEFEGFEVCIPSTREIPI